MTGKKKKEKNSYWEKIRKQLHFSWGDETVN